MPTIEFDDDVPEEQREFVQGLFTDPEANKNKIATLLGIYIPPPSPHPIKVEEVIVEEEEEVIVEENEIIVEDEAILDGTYIDDDGNLFEISNGERVDYNGSN